MALKGLKKADQDTKQQDIDNFISGASKRVKTLEKSQQKYLRLTFSLTKDVDKLLKLQFIIYNSFQRMS